MQKCDKLDEVFNIRIPSVLKNHIEELTPEQKKHIHMELLAVMAHAIHESKFSASLYLSTENSTETM